MRRFELIEGASSKFWEISLADCELTVCYGRIGTNGQVKTKVLASAGAAAAEAAKLIKEKTGKGYQEAAASQAAASAAATAPAELAPRKPPAATGTAAPAQAEVRWPSGGFRWTPDLHNSLPVVRGLYVPKLELPPALPAFEIHGAFNTTIKSYINSELQSLVDRLHAAHYPLPLPPDALDRRTVPLWSPQEAAARFVPATFAQPDPVFWEDALLQCVAYNRYSTGHLPDRWLQTCLRFHGLSFLLERVLAVLPALVPEISAWNVGHGFFGCLRHAIAAADDAAYRSVLAVAGAARGDNVVDCVLCWLFPEERTWADDCASRTLAPQLRFWLDCSLLSVPAMLHHLDCHVPELPMQLPAALLQIQQHDAEAWPVLARLLDRCGAQSDLLKILRRLHTPHMITVVAERAGRKAFRQALAPLVGDWPAATLREAIRLTAERHDPELEDFAVRLALRLPAVTEAVLQTCSTTERERFEPLLRPYTCGNEAPAEALPELLRLPPWQQAAAADLPTLALTQLPVKPEVDWPGNTHIQWLHCNDPRYQAGGALADHPDTSPLADSADPEAMSRTLSRLAIHRASHERLLAGAALQPEDIDSRSLYELHPEHLQRLPRAVALAIWNGMPFEKWAAWRYLNGAKIMLARHQLDALPGLLLAINADPKVGLELAHPFGTPEIAPLAAHALNKSKKARTVAANWLLEHAEIALIALLPAAFGVNRRLREDAQAAVRWLGANGQAELAQAVSHRYGAEACAALAKLLSCDPRLQVPAKMPTLPPFFVPALCRRPRLPDGRVLPLPAVEAIGSMLAISSLEEPYAGLEIVKASCRHESLAEFVWDLFEAWTSAGSPSKESWAFIALGLLGNDETARRLAPRIREWPGESAHARAVTGLDLLAAIGTDVALMHLNGIAEKVKFKALQDRAREKIAAVAEARGLTRQDLADRLVPDLGLDDKGTLLLDFGPRRFQVGFDEALKPFVKDEAGIRRKDLPKPNKGDDAGLAEGAVERYKALKKDARTVASQQVIRLEQAMCTRRRWTAANFRLFFAEHPLLRHLAYRLAWSVYHAGQLTGAFRIAEDLSLADHRDDAYTLPDDAQVGIAHPLEMSPELAGALSQIFADYEILQPFKQLGRETYAPTAEELQARAITRFKDKKVATGSIMGLTNRGWERGDAQDAGWIGWFTKSFSDTDGYALEAVLSLDPGTYVGDPAVSPVQRITDITILPRGDGRNQSAIDLAKVDPILISEMIRDADLLAPLS